MKTFLHVGYGPKRKDKTTAGLNTNEWQELRLDIDANVKPDIVGTMLDMSADASASVDAVYSTHNIEHLYPHEVPVALKEFLRVLNPDGFAVITCPDLKSVCALITTDKLAEPAYTAAAGPIAPLDILYGHRLQFARGNRYMAHHCGVTQKVLQATPQQIGFKSIASYARPQHFELWAIACKEVTIKADIRNLAGEHFQK